MNELIDHIRAAVAQGATAEQKATGAQACRTILTALEAEPGTAIVPLGVPAANPMSRPSLDQVLDLVIARLSTIAQARESLPVRETPRALRTATAPNNPHRAPHAAPHDGKKR